MGKIHILDEAVAGRIAAGEVVERPASIIKELIENSIDAGASSISVAIEDGGIRRIRVTDNGNGISAEDMPLTVVKHATSKLKNAEDLERIYTMGFRGEALFSISAVSMLKITSRQKGSDIGCELSCSGGGNISLNEAGVPEGTSVLVENLFYNTPARLKFLKKPSVEAAKITDLVSKLIISHPEISFKYSSNGVTIYHSIGNGKLTDAIALIYGKETAAQIIPVDFEYLGMKVGGFIGQPQLNFKTRKNESIFLNSRYIKSSICENAVLRGYGERFLKGAHPFYVLNLTLPAEDVDVNVHPNKLSVHFRDDNAVYYLISTAVRTAIELKETAPKVILKQTEIKEQPKQTAELKAEVKPQIEKPLKTLPEKPAPVIKKQEEETLTDSEAKEAFHKILSRYETKAPEKLTAYQAPDYSKKPIPAKDFSSVFTEVSKPKVEEVKEQPAPLFTEPVFSYKIIGTLFNTYILAECGERVYIIDQHALHERLIYDELLKRGEDAPVINLLISDVVTLSSEEAVIIEENLELLNSMGYSIETFGPMSFKIDAVPKVSGELNAKAMLIDAANELKYGGKEASVRKERIAKAACKAAIKGGDVITEAQIVAFLKEMQATKATPHCPHGRPIYTVLTKTELEKSFKRRV